MSFDCDDDGCVLEPSVPLSHWIHRELVIEKAIEKKIKKDAAFHRNVYVVLITIFRIRRVVQHSTRALPLQGQLLPLVIREL